MTTITIPRETWDAMREALESSAVCIQLMSDGPSRASWGDTLDIIDAALAAANAEQPQAPKFWEPSSFEVEAALVAQSKAFMRNR